MIMFTNNNEVVLEIKKTMLEKGIKQKELCEKLGTLPQTFRNTLSKKQLSFNDVSKILQAMDCELYFEIRQKKEE